MSIKIRTYNFDQEPIKRELNSIAIENITESKNINDLQYKSGLILQTSIKANQVLLEKDLYNSIKKYGDNYLKIYSKKRLNYFREIELLFNDFRSKLATIKSTTEIILIAQDIDDFILHNQMFLTHVTSEKFTFNITEWRNKIQKAKYTSGIKDKIFNIFKWKTKASSNILNEALSDYETQYLETIKYADINLVFAQKTFNLALYDEVLEGHFQRLKQLIIALNYYFYRLFDGQQVYKEDLPTAVVSDVRTCAKYFKLFIDFVQKDYGLHDFNFDKEEKTIILLSQERRSL